MCFSTGKQCSLRKHLYILLGSSGHSVQRTSDDGHQYILLSCLGNSVILSKGRQAMVISIFCCPVWELSTKESQVTAVGTCSVWEVAVILSQESQAIVTGLCCCPI